MKKFFLFLMTCMLGATGMLAQEVDVTTLDWVQKGQGCTMDFDNPNGGTVFGTDAGGTNLSYVDISNYGVIKLYGEAGQRARLFVNREEIGDKGIIYVDINSEGVGEYDLSGMLALQPTIQYIHLNGVKASAWNTKLNLSKITVSGDPIDFPELLWTCPEGETDVTKLPWVKKSQDCTNNLSLMTDAPVYGTDAGGSNISYVDITNYGTIKVYGPAGQRARFFINRDESASFQFYVDIDENGVGVLDLNDVYATQVGLTYIHLNGVKASAPGEKVQIDGITVCGDPATPSVDPNMPAYDKVEADVTTFSKSTLQGNDFVLAAPTDLTDYKYMIVTTIQSAGNMGGGMVLTDASGKTAGNSWGAVAITYDKTAAGTRTDMWLDRWNNQHCACINLESLRMKGLDTKNITKFSVPNGENISAIYLTNYTEGQAVKSTEGWGTCTGDYVRQNALLSEGKYGTIALKYAAAVSGAKLYTVDSFDAEAGMVLSEVEDGIAEAGVPYIYVACDFEGHDASDGNKGSNSNVNFYRVDANAVSGDWSDNAARDNGLVGYYDGGFWPGAGALNGCYIIAQNELHKIDGGDIDLGTNRCFFDPAKCSSKSGAGVKAFMSVAGNETAIQTIETSKQNAGKIFDINGREVKSMKKGGLYIVNGMKLFVK